MTRRDDGWAEKARRLESAIGAHVERAARSIGGASSRQPLELVHAITDTLERELQPAGRGQRVFPFTHVRVSFAAPTPRDEGRIQAACDGPPTLRQRIEDRLRRSGCADPGVSVEIAFVSAAGDTWEQPEFHLECRREVIETPAAVPAAVPRIALSVTHGTAARSYHSSSGTTVALGRGAEVRDSRHRLVRTNHVAFLEGEDAVNQTVSRRHARVDWDAPAGAYRLFDETGAGATSVIRDGRGLAVPQGRGLRLRTGDVIVIGDARMAVTIDG